MDVNAVGNRCADLIAGSSCNVSVPVLNPLRLELGERWLYVTRADGSVLYDDVRRATLDRARDVNLDLWKSSPSQNAFADVAVLNLCSQMLSDKDVVSDSKFVRFLLCVISNTLQYHWVDTAAASDKVQQRCCCDCGEGVVLDVQHVLECSAKEIKRNEWCVNLIEYLNRFVLVTAVSHLSTASTWKELITCMFGARDSKSMLRFLFGGFGTLEAYHMLSCLPVLNRVVVKQVTLELRKRMLEQMHVLWNEMCV